jgi:hypothetical protein
MAGRRPRVGARHPGLVMVSLADGLPNLCPEEDTIWGETADPVQTANES